MVWGGRGQEWPPPPAGHRQKVHYQSLIAAQRECPGLPLHLVTDSELVFIGNAMHAVRTQCEVLDVDKYSNPSFSPFSQVFGSVPGLF